jgi:signal transduction histidine kinase
MNFLPENSRRLAGWVTVIVVVSVAAAMTVTWRAPALNQLAHDALARARGPTKPPPEIVIVAIDEASVKRYGRFPWPRTLMAQALDKLSAARPKVIALTVLFSDPTNERDDGALVEALRRAGNVVVAAQLIETAPGGAAWARPLPAIEQAAAAVGHGNVLTDFDGVARALSLREADDEGNALWAIAAEVMRVGEGGRPEELRETPGAVLVGPRVIPVGAGEKTVSVAPREPQVLPLTYNVSRMAIDYVGPAGSFADQTVSVADVIDGRVDPGRFKDKIVLIGATAASMGDRVASPFARRASNDEPPQGALMSGVEVSANAVTTILRSRFYRQTPDWMTALAAALAAAGVIVALSLAQGDRELARQILALAGMIGLVLGLCYFAFARWMIAPPLVASVVSLVVAAPLAILLRSLAISASLDDRIAEMARESARLSPVAAPASEAPPGERRPWWPRGAARKARSLAVLQNRLFERTQFVDRALQSVEDGLLISDRSGRIAFANPRAAKILGLPESSLLGSDLFDRLAGIERGHENADADRLARAKKEALARLFGDRVAVEREIVSGAAERRYYTLRMAAVSDGQGAGSRPPLGVVATLSDVTKQRELQQMQGDVIRLVTHEMKTPLTAIKGMSEVMMKFEAAPEKRREMSATINEASRRLTRLIDDYLDLTSLESGARAPRLAFLRVESIIEQNLLLLEPVAAARGVRLTRQFAPEGSPASLPILSSGSTSNAPVLPPALADGDLLARALTNLVANAIKYSPADTEVVVSARAGDGAIFISVADHGYGIPAEYLAHIFEKFFRAPREEDADTPGAGLGLSLVREIAELHGGRVTVESEVGAGSIFTLRLPLRRDPDSD